MQGRTEAPNSAMDEFGFEKLDVWQLGMELVDRVYVETKALPKEELWGLVSQMRRAGVSIPSNIAEGCGTGQRQFSNFLRIARGSSFELRTQIEIARRQTFLEDVTAKEMIAQASRVSRMLDGLIRSLTTKEFK